MRSPLLLMALAGPLALASGDPPADSPASPGFFGRGVLGGLTDDGACAPWGQDGGPAVRGAGQLTEDDLRFYFEDAPACVEGDTCVIVEEPCNCDHAVNATRVKRAKRTASKFTCDKPSCCSGGPVARCQFGRCTASGGSLCGMISLNLKDAELRNVLELLAERNRRTFVVHPAVTGTVTIKERGDAYDLLERLLKRHRLAMSVKAMERTVWIAPAAEKDWLRRQPAPEEKSSAGGRGGCR